MEDVVFEFSDGSGVWLVAPGDIDSRAGSARKSCQREHARRVREGLPCAGVLRKRRVGERICNDPASRTVESAA
jgi:hypothetical protein